MIGPRGRAGVVLVAVFATGTLVGKAWERHHGGSRSIVVSMEEDHAAALGELREVLDLDEAQIEELHRILTDRQELVQHMWEQLRPEVQDAMMGVHEEFSATLRPDQRQRFHVWLEEQRALQHAPRHR